MKKLTIALSVLAVAFLGLAVLTGAYSVNRAEEAIDAIGKVAYDAESRQLLDEAIESYEALDAGSRDRRVSNAAALEAARLEYGRLAIKTVKVASDRKVADGITDAEIAAAVADAREAVDAYCSDGLYEQLENYDDLLALEAQYGASAGADTGTADDGGDAGGEEEAEEIEIC